MGKLVLATSLLTSYGYLSEQSLSWYAGDTVEWYTYWFRLSGFGQYALITWTLFFCNTIVPQILWFRRLRRKESVLVVVSLLVLVGMWLERYMIITTSLSRDYLPSSWGFFKPTIWDIADVCRLGRACSWWPSCCSPASRRSCRCRRRGPCCPARTGRRWDDEAEARRSTA